MKAFYYALIFSLLASSYTYAQTTLPSTRQTQKQFPSGWQNNPPYGYLEYVPDGYASAANGSLPLVIFLHGVGETGNGTTDLYKVANVGAANLIKTDATIAKQEFNFIMLSPQDLAGQWFNPITVNKFIDYALANYPKADPNRIYITGLSYGGSGTWQIGAYAASRLAGIIPISYCGGALTDGPKYKTLPVWAHVNSGDASNPDCMGKLIQSITNAGGSPEFTVYNASGHDAWTTTYKDASVWKWLLSQRKGNGLATVNAGPDKALVLPNNTVTITGTASDSDGAINSYTWTKVSGPSATMSGASTPTLSLSNLVAGVYTFRLTVEDNINALAFDEVSVMVSASGNVAPIANAGADKTVTLPTTSIDLYGSATDSDGTIASYAWSKVSGPSVITGVPTGANLSLTYLVAGTYVFRLTAMDNGFAVNYDEVTIRVNVAPTANAGADKTIALPTNTTTLTGSGADADGTIASYLWTKQSGPTVTMGATNSASLSLSNLVAGTYVFRLKVTDNNGGSAFDDVTVTVTGSNNAPVANAGADKSITLPTNSLTIVGSGSDSDGTIASYAWTKLSGPTVTMSGANTASLSLSNLVQGTYVFRLTVQDNIGATASDDVTVVVAPAPNVNPVANAGADQSITLPTNSITLSGSGTDSDGTIASYSWIKVTGPTVTMSNANTASLSLSNLVEGTYVFRLTVQDNAGATASDDVNVVVSPAPNVNPVANAGADQSITLPTNSITLTGSATDSDGTITSYLWTQQSGPSASTLTNNTSAAVTISNLVKGTYIFRLSVTDNNGAIGFDEATVTVSDPVIISPVYRVNAGGSSVAGSPTWTADSPTQSPYLTAAFSNTGGCNCLTENTTGVPDAIFISNRQTTSSGGLQWNFPVSNGTYTVNLYFAEFWGGTRKFKIVMENIVKELSYEIAAEFGVNKAGKKTYTVSVTDGNLDLDLITVLNGAVISGIEIIPGGSARIANDEEQAQVEMTYPNPATDKIYISLPGQNGNAIITIADGVGKTLRTSDVEIMDEKLELSVADLPVGIHHLLIKSGSKTKFVRFIKE